MSDDRRYPYAEPAQDLLDDLMDTLLRDFKNPLSAVIGALELLQEAADDSLDDYARQLIHTAQQAAYRQNMLVEDILSTVRMEAGEMAVTLQPTAIGRLVEQCVAESAPIIAQRNLTLQTDFASDLPPARADGALLRRVIANLLENAIKSTPEGGSISIHATIAGDEVRFAVTDGGYPVPPELHEAIFDRRLRGNVAVKGARAGMGFGLAFCRLAITAMHGRIWVESAYNTGGTFCFALPTNET